MYIATIILRSGAKFDIRCTHISITRNLSENKLEDIKIDQGDRNELFYLNNNEVAAILLSDTEEPDERNKRD